MNPTSPALWAVRFAFVVAGLAGWFWTQRLIARRECVNGRIGDRMHDWTAPVNRYLLERPGAANVLLIVTSAIIDVLGLFLLGRAIFGQSVRPFVGLLVVYVLRQFCQGVCALPAPDGMIWRHPGVPSLLVTYGTATDLFFSGHTAIAVYGAVELARLGGPVLPLLGVALAVIEAGTVLVLRAHYTMDVVAAVIAALWAATVAETLAPFVDQALASLIGA